MIRESLNEADITLSGLNIRNLGPTESGHPGLEGTLRQVDWDVHLARALRLKAANLRSGIRSNEARDNLIQGVNTILSDTPDITLNLGNQKNTCLETLQDFRDILPELPDRAHILLDTGQFLTTGQNILQFTGTFADRIRHIHLRDQKNGQPVPFGEGDLPLGDLLTLLKETNYNGYLVFELEGAHWGDPASIALAARESIGQVLAE